MYLRFFVALDESPIGKLALSYMPALARIAPVRLIDPDRLGLPELPGRWARYHRALETPMVGPFVNLVCTRPERWTWTLRIEAALEDKPDAAVKTELIEGRAELYTAGVRNVLIASLGAAEFSKLPDAQRETAIKYQALVRPSDIPVPVTDHAAFRRIILGE